MSKLTLNVALVESNPDVTITVGVQRYEKSTLDTLREEHRGRYLVKRGGEDGNSILTVPRKAGLPALGTSSTQVKLAEAPWLLAPLAMEALLEFFTQLQRPILRSRPLRVVSQRPTNLLPVDTKLPPWLQRRVVLDFETRTVYGADRRASVILACGVRTRNAIEANCAETLGAGIPLIGRYVGRKRNALDSRALPYLKLAGRVIDFGGLC